MCHATSGWPNSLPSSAFKVSHLVFQRFYFIFEFCVSCVFERGFAPMWAQATWSSQERAGGSGAGVTGGCGQPSVLPRMILCKSSVACNHRGPLRFYWFWSLSFQMNFKLCCCCYRFSFSSLIKKKKMLKSLSFTGLTDWRGRNDTGIVFCSFVSQPFCVLYESLSLALLI